MNPFLKQCTDLIGQDYVITNAADMARYVTDYRRRATGKALAVLKPATTEEVARIVDACARQGVAIVPQGGNTGLVLGSVPDQTGQAVVLSLQRLTSVRQLDTLNNTITVEAGCILQDVQGAASDVDRLFPLSLASEGSCTIGGNLATNAGGTAVLHYGTCRALCLGLEVVTPQGEIWNGLKGLRKDNTGYDLRDLYIGSEGTLGIVTAAVMQLFPKPKSNVTAIAVVPSIQAAIDLLHLIRATNTSAVLSAFELMSTESLALVARYMPHLKPLRLQASTDSYYVLIEFSSQDEEAQVMLALENNLALALEKNRVSDAAIARSLTQSQAFWSLRESISDAQAAAGKNIKHDISLPISAIASFVEHTERALQQSFPECRVVVFGHLGDGNLHYNVSRPLAMSEETFMQQEPVINRLVYDQVERYRGSISAEHGLGALKVGEILRHKGLVEMNLMRAIKRALDPLNIMNPGKVLLP